MKTTIVSVDPLRPQIAELERAKDLLQRGELVAFPTETVYGLGANALDPEAVARIFEAKGRPSTNPVIVHVADVDSARELVAEWPQSAARLAERFWPGPLTLVLPKSERIPDIVTANGPTVAVRVPSHPVALALLRGVGLPIAAPSANRSNFLSPTTAEHVNESLGGRIPLILDGGSCPGGIESTVIDITTDPPCVLRPGLLGVDALEDTIGPIEVGADSSGGVLPSPGMLSKHYSPRTPTVCVEAGSDFAQEPGRVIVLEFGSGREGSMVLPLDPLAAAARLYSTLHTIDEAGADRLVVVLPPNEREWLGVRDRLLRAGG